MTQYRRRTGKRITLGDTLLRKRDQKPFKLTHLGSWSGEWRNRKPITPGPQIWLVAEDGEEVKLAETKTLYAMFDVKTEQVPNDDHLMPEYYI